MDGDYTDVIFFTSMVLCSWSIVLLPGSSYIKTSIISYK